MRLCRIDTDDGPSLGQVDDGTIRLLDGDLFGHLRERGRPVPLAKARFLPPVLPPTFYAAGLNYLSHIEESRRKGNAKAVVPTRPDIGHRANSALVGHGADIVRPTDFEGRLEYEGELVAVIGATLRYADRQQAKDAIFGWTIGNDVSAREWQHGDRTMWRGKNSDTFKPMGPWIDTEFDPKDSVTTVRLNGAVSSRFDTANMIYDAVDFIVEITRYITLSPGDVIWHAPHATPGMPLGDLVGVEISGLGVLTNRIVAEKAAQQGATP